MPDEPTSLEHAWAEFLSRNGWPKSAPPWLRSAWFEGYAAGAGYALSAVKKLAGAEPGTWDREIKDFRGTKP